MEQVHLVCNETEEIKRIVIGIEELRCRKSIECGNMNPDEITQEYISLAEESARAEILHLVGKYVSFTLNPWEQYTEAQIYLPYITDSVVKRLKSNISNAMGRATLLEQQNEDLETRIEELRSRPWWKRILNN